MVSLQIITGYEINGDAYSTKDIIVVTKTIYGIKY